VLAKATKRSLRKEVMAAAALKPTMSPALAEHAAVLTMTTTWVAKAAAMKTTMTLALAAHAAALTMTMRPTWVAAAAALKLNRLPRKEMATWVVEGSVLLVRGRSCPLPPCAWRGR
jgi:hypothetical protein